MLNNSHNPKKINEANWIILVLILLGVGGGTLLSIVGQTPPIIIALLLGLGVSSAIYQFLGGAHGVISTGAFRIGGTAAIFFIVTIFVDTKLVDQATMVPDPKCWVAIKYENGTPTTVQINGQARSIPNLQKLKEIELSAELNNQKLILYPNVKNRKSSIGYVDYKDLSSSAFSKILDPDEAIFTTKLHINDTYYLEGPCDNLSLKIQEFTRGRNNFRVECESSDAARYFSLKKGDCDICSFGDDSYIFSVTQANHQMGHPDSHYVKLVAIKLNKI